MQHYSFNRSVNIEQWLRQDLGSCEVMTGCYQAMMRSSARRLKFIFGRFLYNCVLPFLCDDNEASVGACSKKSWRHGMVDSGIT